MYISFQYSRQEDYDRLRSLSYPNTDVFLLCFSIDTPSSYENIKSKWAPELKRASPDIPFLLIGTKSDKRGGEVRCTTQEMGQKLCNEIGAKSYLECSAMEKNGLKEVFDEAIKCVLVAQRKAAQTRRRKICSIL